MLILIGGIIVLASTLGGFMIAGGKPLVLLHVSEFVVILGVAASRVYFGVHYPSDVIGGMLAGAAWIAAVTGWFYPRLLPGEAAGEGR